MESIPYCVCVTKSITPTIFMAFFLFTVPQFLKCRLFICQLTHTLTHMGKGLGRNSDEKIAKADRSGKGWKCLFQTVERSFPSFVKNWLTPDSRAISPMNLKMSKPNSHKLFPYSTVGTKKSRGKRPVFVVVLTPSAVFL